MLTDIESSSTRWESDASTMRAAMARHDEIVAEIVVRNDGQIVKHLGDGCWAVFTSATRSLDAAAELLAFMQHGPWEFGNRFALRIGLHAGAVEPDDDDYFGPVPNRAARIVDLANGNQVVCSGAVAGLLPDSVLRHDGPHELRGIGIEEIYTVLDDRYDADDRPLRQAVVPNNLPRARTSFVGRADVAATVASLLVNKPPVVTLIGPGGVGKTRLAVEVGSALQRDEHARVHFCDLAAVAVPNAVADAVAEAIGARRQPRMDVVDSIVDYLRDREVCLILDNCEHVIDAARDIVQRLQVVDTLQLLATSREALREPGEQLVVVSPLPPDTAGVELFVQRVREREPIFEADHADRDTIGSIVRRLDGIPLAIELAAAWGTVMTPVEMLERLDDTSLLHDERRDTRHVTLRDTIAWSYDLLSPSEAALFERMSVFDGGCTLDAIEAVCAGDSTVNTDEVPALVLALVDKSMVVSRRDGRHRRFFVLETLRRFGRERLEAAGADGKIRQRHADFACDLAKREGQRILSRAESAAWTTLDSEWANLRSALDWYQSQGSLHEGAELVSSLVMFASFSMRFELFGWSDELLAAPGIEHDDAFVDLCGASAIGAYFTVDPRVTELAELGLRADPTDPRGFCRIALAALLLNNLHASDDSDALTSAWLDAAPTDPGSQLWSEAFRTFHLCVNGRPEEAAAHVTATADIATRTGSPSATALAAWAAGQLATYDSIERAIDVWTGGFQWTRSLPGEHLIDHLLTGLILNFVATGGALAGSLEQCRDAIQLALDHHYVAGTSHLFGVTAIVLCRADDAATGAQLVGAMIANGHMPRPNARRALEKAFATTDLEPHFAPGHDLSITEAARIAIDALTAAIARTSETTSPTSHVPQLP